MMRALLLFFTLFSSAFALQAATPKDTLVVAVPLDGIISFDPAESFETVSNSVQRNIYQTLVEADRDAPQNSRRCSPPHGSPAARRTAGVQSETGCAFRQR